MVSANLLFFALAAVSSVLAHPISHNQDLKLRIVGRDQSATFIRRAETKGNETKAVANFDVLSAGNQKFRETVAKEELKKLADDGQEPPFMFIGCSDSRVSEGTVFNAKPGTLFTQRNIANQFLSSDINAQSVLSYAVAELGVNHVIVMGHYGCGGVAASIASPPVNQIDAANGAVQNWIRPIREIFQSSSRTEIVELRNKLKGQTVIEEPDIKEPGFRALVEENVKAGVARIATDSVITNHYAALASGGLKRRAEGGPITDVFIHGWVYDIENGEIRDLGISVGPPGKAIPPAPFAAVAKSAIESTAGHSSSKSTTTAKSTASSTPAAEPSVSATVAASKAASPTAPSATVAASAQPKPKAAETPVTVAGAPASPSTGAANSGIRVIGMTA